MKRSEVITKDKVPEEYLQWFEKVPIEEYPIEPTRVCDPFAGSGTTVMVANRLGRVGIGLDLAHTYLHDQARERTGLAAAEAFYGKGKGSDTVEEPLDELPLFAAKEKE